MNQKIRLSDKFFLKIFFIIYSFKCRFYTWMDTTDTFAPFFKKKLRMKWKKDGRRKLNENFAIKLMMNRDHGEVYSKVSENLGRYRHF